MKIPKEINVFYYENVALKLKCILEKFDKEMGKFNSNTFFRFDDNKLS